MAVSIVSIFLNALTVAFRMSASSQLTTRRTTALSVSKKVKRQNEQGEPNKTKSKRNSRPRLLRDLY